MDMDIVWAQGLENLTNEDILFTLNFVNSQPEHFVYFSLDEENDKIFVHCHQITKDGFSKETLDLMFWSFAIRSQWLLGY